MSAIYPSTSSGLKTATAQITTRNSLLHTVMLDPPSSGTSSLTVYDSSAAGTTAGTELAYLEIDSTTATSVVLTLTNAVEAKNGIYAVLSGTGSSYVIHYGLL